MIHTAIAGLYAETISCGLNSRAWHEPELPALQKQLGEIHLPQALADGLQFECVADCHLLETTSPDEVANLLKTGIHSASDLGWWFIPRGWTDQNRAVMADLEMEMMGCVDCTNGTISPLKSKTARAHMNDEFRRRTPDNFIAGACVPNVTKAALIVARNQTWVDHTLIVCALERYRLANGKCPATLADLVPQYLDKIPNDIITGTPMKYVLKNNQTFLLYSVGWNESDEVGITVRDRDGNEDRESGDWVWHYPE